MPKHCKHKASGSGVVRLDGRDYYTGEYGTDKAEREYHRLVAEWSASRANGNVYNPGSDQLLIELVASYETFVEVRYSDQGAVTAQQRRIKMALATLLALYADRPARSFGPLALEAVRQQMIGKQWSVNFINHSVNAIRQMFRWAAKRELLPASVYDQLRTLERLKPNAPGVKASKPVRPVSLQAARRTLRQTLPVVRHLCYLQHLTGMRAGEAAAIRPCDVNQAGLDPHGFRHPGVWVYAPPEHKTAHKGKQRVVFIGRRGQSILRLYLNREPTAYCFSPKEAVLAWLAATGRKATLRRSRQPGERYTTTAIDKAVRKAAARAGESHWSPHQLRHTRATEIRSLYGPDAARIVLGHSLPGVTGVYAESDLRMAAKVMREIG